MKNVKEHFEGKKISHQRKLLKNLSCVEKMLYNVMLQYYGFEYKKLCVTQGIIHYYAEVRIVPTIVILSSTNRARCNVEAFD